MTREEFRDYVDLLRSQDDRSIWETAGVETALDMFGETLIEADKKEGEE